MISALALFFYDGNTFTNIAILIIIGKKIRRNLIKQLIKHLTELHNAVSACIGFRFYSVSLLLIYDGSIDDADFADDRYAQVFLRDKVKVDLIDFANTVCDPNLQDADKDLLEGVENLIKKLTYIQDNTDVLPCLA